MIDMGMSSMILDNVEQFWSRAHKTIGECECVEEWEEVMKTHEHLLQGSEDADHIKEVGYVAMWNDYWADYV